MTLSDLVIERDKESGLYILRYDASLHINADCKQYVWNRLLNGYTTEHKDFKMEYGTAGHHALAHWYRGNHNQQECLALAMKHYAGVIVPEDDWRSMAHLVNCLMQYFAAHEHNDQLSAEKIGDQWLVEKNFALPFYRTPRCEVLLSGTMDIRGLYIQRRVVADHKFTAMANKPGMYLRKASLSPQLMTYVLANKMMFSEQETIGAILNVIFLLKSNKNFFQRSEIVEFSDWQLKYHHDKLLTSVKEIVASFEKVLDGGVVDDNFKPNFTQCSKEYGMCEFSALCQQQCESDRNVIAETSFVRKVYDPLKFQQ